MITITQIIVQATTVVTKAPTAIGLENINSYHDYFGYRGGRGGH